MDVGAVLIHLLVVLAAAKVAAEASERVGIPAVVGEILVGVVIGPSVLGWVRADDVISTLAELGVILLLLEVGLGMDVEELGSVGRSALAVAVVGVAAPFVAGAGVGAAFGMSATEAVFVGAALTATSVGVTARVFGDLRALASIEARTVLGAAIADDVLGLVILTVVVRVATAGSVSMLSVAGVVAMAVLFLAVTTLVGIRVVPLVFDVIGRFSRSGGTVLGLTLVFALAVAELANAVKLAPIVGAFVAGLVLSRSRMAPRVARELAPVNHLLVPIFFLQIGIEAKVERFVSPSVVGLAAGLLAVAVAGKLVAAVAVRRGGGDRILIALGMIPRGEVGLIFATIGLQQHVFGDDVYAAVLLVVLASTVVTPSLLRWRIRHARPVRLATVAAGGSLPDDWCQVRQTGSSTVVDLAGEPPGSEVLLTALRLAGHADSARIGATVFDWFDGLPRGPLRWSDASRAALRELLPDIGPRGWRLLLVSGVLERSLPEVAHAVQTHPDRSDLDPVRSLDFPAVARVQDLLGSEPVPRPDLVVLAALLRTVADDDRAAITLARRTTQRLGTGAGDEEALASLVRDVELFLGVARRLDGSGPERVLQLASHLGDVGQATGLYLLAAAEQTDPVVRRRLAALRDRLLTVLATPALASRESANAVEALRSAAGRLVSDDRARRRVESAPRALVLSQPSEVLARQAALVAELGVGRYGFAWDDVASGGWRVDIAARDQLGLLATQAEALAAFGLRIFRADIATWDDGATIGTFLVDGDRPPSDGLSQVVADAAVDGSASRAVPDAGIDFDNVASPWHTVCRVTATDRPRLLADLAGACMGSGVNVHSAVVATEGERAIDVFEVTDANGAKLTEAAQESLTHAMRSGRPDHQTYPRLHRARTRLRRLALP